MSVPVILTSTTTPLLRLVASTRAARDGEQKANDPTTEYKGVADEVREQLVQVTNESKANSRYTSRKT